LFRHGFKTWCETVAAQQRHRLQVPPTGALDPRLLAHDMGVMVLALEPVPHLAPGTIEQRRFKRQ
jgi:hypothetical protein